MVLDLVFDLVLDLDPNPGVALDNVFDHVLDLGYILNPGPNQENILDTFLDHVFGYVLFYYNCKPLPSFKRDFLFGAGGVWWGAVRSDNT